MHHLLPEEPKKLVLLLHIRYSITHIFLKTHIFRDAPLQATHNSDHLIVKTRE